MRDIKFKWLSPINYSSALELQEELVVQRLAGEICDHVVFIEAEPVYTIGRTRDRSSLEDVSASLPHPVVEINRGGQATYHGPGQIVGNFILDLTWYGKDLHIYLRALEEILIQYLNSLELDARRREGLTGVWVEDRKIASIGIGVKKWISMHGFGLNVADDLSGYGSITPCGISGVRMTSIATETGDPNWTPKMVIDSIEPFVIQELEQLAQLSKG